MVALKKLPGNSTEGLDFRPPEFLNKSEPTLNLSAYIQFGVADGYA